MKRKFKNLFLMTLMTALGMVSIGETKAANKISLSKKEVTIRVGESKTIKVKNGTKKAKWSVTSGKKNIELKSKRKTSVKVVGIKKGKAKVQVKIGRKKLFCKITIKKVRKKESLTVNNSSIGSDATAQKDDSKKQTSSIPQATKKPVVVPTNSPEPTKEPMENGMKVKQKTALEEMIRTINDAGGEVSEDLTNAGEYEWSSEGDLISLDWRNKEVNGDLSFESFPNLQELYSSEGAITSLDVSKNTELRCLYCDANEIQELNLDTNSRLIELEFC